MPSSKSGGSDVVSQGVQRPMKQIDLRVLKRYLTDSVKPRRYVLEMLFEGMKAVRGETFWRLDDETMGLVEKFREAPATPDRWTADSVSDFLRVHLHGARRDPEVVFQQLVDLCGGSR